MAQALMDLVALLQSKQGQERMTQEEANVLIGCKSSAKKGFAIGGTIATGLTWLATRKLNNNFLRVNLAGGAGFITGMWSLNESIDSCINRMLGMEGSRIQLELRNIVLQRYGNVPDRMRAFSKHFYTEQVINDSTGGLPKAVFRQRNIYVEDDVVRFRKAEEKSEVDNKDAFNRGKSDTSNSKPERPTVDRRKVQTDSSVSMVGIGDPLDVMFGPSLAYEESPQAGDSKATATTSHHRRITRRRHRLRQRRLEKEANLS